MSNFGRAGNTAVLSNTKVQRFEGIKGQELQVSNRSTPDGDDISTTVANLVQDVKSDKFGRIRLRDGCQKMETTGRSSSIGSIFQINIGGRLAFGIVYGGRLDLLTMPAWVDFPEPLFDDLPDDSKPSDWPSDEPWYPPMNDRPSDPTDDPDNQTCELDYTITRLAPESLTFTMPYAGTPTPSSGNLWHKIEGYTKPLGKLVGTYNSPGTGFSTSIGASRVYQLGPCVGVNIGSLKVVPTGKDSSGNWLAPGTYSYTPILTYSEGSTISWTVTLIVAPPEITLTPTSYNFAAIEGGTDNASTVINIENSGDSGSVLNWEIASITGDAALTAIMSLSVTSGTLNSGESENTTLTLASPGALSSGTYGAVITFRDSNLTTVTGTFTVSLEVSPLYASRIKWDITEDITYTLVSGNPAGLPSDTTSSQTQYTRTGGPASNDPYFWSTSNASGGSGAIFGYNGDVSVTEVGVVTLSWGEAEGFNYWTGLKDSTGSLGTGGCPSGGWTRTIDDPSVIFNGACYYTVLKTYTITVGPE